MNPIGAQRDRLGERRCRPLRQAPSCPTASPPLAPGFAELPGFAMNAANYKEVEKAFRRVAVSQTTVLDVFSCPALKAWSKPGESEGEFGARLAHAAREARDAAVEKLRAATAKKTGDPRRQTSHAGRRGPSSQRKGRSRTPRRCRPASRCSADCLGGLLGRKMHGAQSLSRGSARPSARASSAYKQHQDVAMAGARVEDLAGELETLQNNLRRKPSASRSNMIPPISSWSRKHSSQRRPT